jgi:hypothetical protein
VTTMSWAAGSSAFAHLLGERLARLLAAGVNDDPFEVPYRRYSLKLTFGLPASPVDAKRVRVLARQMLRCNPARGAGAHLPEPVRLHDREQLPTLGVEEHGVEVGAGARDRVCLEAEGADLGRSRGHKVEPARRKGHAPAGAVGGPSLRVLA